MKTITLVLGITTLAGLSPCLAQSENSTFFNPVLPGAHADPSCIGAEDVFYCATSTFISFPGNPIYASKDLINWKIISQAWNRESQLPDVSWGTTGQTNGFWAPTLRYHDGEFFLINIYQGGPQGRLGTLFRTKDIYNDAAWGNLAIYSRARIDPDLFWDDDDKVYSAGAGIDLSQINLSTGALASFQRVWAGTSLGYDEGPHIYKKDGYYYLLIAEGGTDLQHSAIIARATDIEGPYEAYEHNPLLTNRGTDEYIQAVGHADLFNDTNGNWWGLCLGRRSGTDVKYYPMGREGFLFPATWIEGEWPILEPVRGNMTGWPLPPRSRNVPGEGAFNGDPDKITFKQGSSIPMHFIYWRVPREGAFTTTSNGLQVVPSRANLTGDVTSDDLALTGRRGLSMIGRRQTHTLFKYSIDINLFSPQGIGQEAGATVFLTQFNHIELGLVLLRGDSDDAPQLYLRLHVEDLGRSTPADKLIVVPTKWIGRPMALHIEAKDPYSYLFTASSTDGDVINMGTVSSSHVSGGPGNFVGSIVGIYATCNGVGQGDDCPEGGIATFQKWRYSPHGQYIDYDEWVSV
ncbi:glycoside hydrolase family 43 protein [Ilyonectria sp. MPI-CAGE-AT-0026]|nr:glycoside hydrolase family 43 protein [Ilyonectria sp. MPI-CAGE-AT-0026]